MDDRHVQAATGKDIVMEDSPVGESQRNGLSEEAVEETTRSHSVFEMGGGTDVWGHVKFRQPCGAVVGASCRFDDFKESSRLGRPDSV